MSGQQLRVELITDAADRALTALRGAPHGQDRARRCKAGYGRKDPYIFGDSVPFGPWTVETSAFRRYGRTGLDAN
ncbi:hypothetical protein GCM10027074_10050 [Streptomyces deserti]